MVDSPKEPVPLPRFAPPRILVRFLVALGLLAVVVLGLRELGQALRARDEAARVLAAQQMPCLPVFVVLGPRRDVEGGVAFEVRGCGRHGEIRCKDGEECVFHRAKPGGGYDALGYTLAR